MKDYVYYLKENGEILLELVFPSEAKAIDYAEKNAINNYEVVEWDVG